MNRRRFLKMLGVGAVLPFIPKSATQPLVFQGFGLSIPSNVSRASFYDGTNTTGAYQAANNRVHSFNTRIWGEPGVFYEGTYITGIPIAFRRKQL